jgi:hypothetical protein
MRFSLVWHAGSQQCSYHLMNIYKRLIRFPTFVSSPHTPFLQHIPLNYPFRQNALCDTNRIGRRSFRSSFVCTNTSVRSHLSKIRNERLIATKIPRSAPHPTRPERWYVLPILCFLSVLNLTFHSVHSKMPDCRCHRRRVLGQHTTLHRCRLPAMDIHGRKHQDLRQQMSRHHKRPECRWHEAPDLDLHQRECKSAVLLYCAFSTGTVFVWEGVY